MTTENEMRQKVCNLTCSGHIAPVLVVVVHHSLCSEYQLQPLCKFVLTER